MLKKWLVFILLAYPMWGAAAQHVLMFEDVSGDMFIEQVLSDPQRFQPTDKTAFGFSDSVFWVRIDLENPATVEQAQVIQFDFHGLEQIRNYRLTEQGFQTSEAGCLVPLAQRSMGLLLPSFHEVLMPGERRSHYVRIESSSGVDLAYSIKTVPEAYSADRRHRIIAVAVLVALATIGLYILISGVLIGSRPNLWYSGYLILLLLTYVFDSQLLHWGDRAWSGVTSILGFVVAQFFMREFFKPSQANGDGQLGYLSSGCGLRCCRCLCPQGYGCLWRLFPGRRSCCYSSWLSWQSRFELKQLWLC